MKGPQRRFQRRNNIYCLWFCIRIACLVGINESLHGRGWFWRFMKPWEASFACEERRYFITFIANSEMREFLFISWWESWENISRPTRPWAGKMLAQQLLLSPLSSVLPTEIFINFRPNHRRRAALLKPRISKGSDEKHGNIKITRRLSMNNALFGPFFHSLCPTFCLPKGI